MRHCRRSRPGCCLAAGRLARATLDERDRALLDFARQFDAARDAVSFEDINRLRVVGFTDQNIFDTVMAVAYFNFINRVAEVWECLWIWRRSNPMSGTGTM